MSGIDERFVTVAVGECRIWEKGDGPRLGYLGGLNGVPRWTPFLDRLAETHRVVVPSPPGFPGSDPHHHTFDSQLDWVSATFELLETADLAGCDLVASSVGGMLAAEVAALSQSLVPRLVLVAPMGIYDVGDPGEDPFAQEQQDAPLVQSADPEAWAAAFAPDQVDDPEQLLAWMMEQQRAGDAAARLTWPFGDHGLCGRLYRLRQPVLLLWGADDRILPPTYAKRFADLIAGPTEISVLDGAGHQVVIDQPDAAAAAVRGFLP